MSRKTDEEIKERIEGLPDMMQEINKSLMSDLSSKKDDMLIEALEKAGHKFETKAHLYNFIKTRCEINSFHNKLNILLVDGVSVFEWWDTITTNYDSEKNIFTATMGLPPSNGF